MAKHGDMKNCKNCKDWQRAHQENFPTLKNKGWCKALDYESDFNRVNVSKGGAVVISRDGELLTDENFYCAKFEKK